MNLYKITTDSHSKYHVIGKDPTDARDKLLAAIKLTNNFYDENNIITIEFTATSPSEPKFICSSKNLLL